MISNNKDETLIDAPCKCVHWARAGGLLMTEHHPNCEKYSPEKEAKAIIEGLLKGMEQWGAEEDGIYPGAWDAYKRGKVFVGQFDWIENKK